MDDIYATDDGHISGDMLDDHGMEGGAGSQRTSDADDTPPEMTEADKALLKRIVKKIKADKKHFEDDFERMRRDMKIARIGYDEKDWSSQKYSANITGRHIRQKTNKLYAKNPKIVARRRETLDFAVWDENMASLQLAFTTLQTAMMQGAMVQAGMPQSVDPTTGIPQAPKTPELPQGFEQAQALMQDFTEGTQRRQQVKKLSRTLEVLFAHAIREQKPLDFKTALKQAVRRACTTGVSYMDVGFQRETGPRQAAMAQLSDDMARLEHLQALTEELQEGELDEDAPERAELERSITALQAEPEIVLREGLVFDFPTSTRVIPDMLCTSLVGFVGARHVTIEYLFTKSQVKELFSIELKQYTAYTATGVKSEDQPRGDDAYDEANEKKVDDSGRLACVWKHYDKVSGLVYYVCDGCNYWLRTPAAPDVKVDDFWPIYALTFNDVESDKNLFPPSDVALLLHMQKEFNRSRDGLREHRKAAVPRWAAAKGSLELEDIDVLKNLGPHQIALINPPPDGDLRKTIVQVPVSGVDPNLYETGPIMSDIELTVGTSPGLMGGSSKSSATESAIAASSASSADGSEIDDLDSFLTRIARASGQILLREMSTELVQKIVGPGAFWPEGLSQTDIYDEVFLEVEAGSTGKPNQAVEIQNWQKMLPFLVQMKGISPTWLARETLRRLDDRMDLTEALVDEIPSMIAQNKIDSAPPQAPPTPGAGGDPRAPAGGPQPGGPGAPGGRPEDQGGAGGDNAPRPPGGPTGSQPAFNSNQV